MLKENGMYKPADEKEVSSVRGKELIITCPSCGHANKVKATFGVGPICGNCKKDLGGDND